MHALRSHLAKFSLLLGITLFSITGWSTGYLLDSQGNPVRYSSGSCVKTGSWSKDKPLAACDGMPDRIILLPGADGKTGKLVVSTAAGERELNKAYGALQVDEAGAIEESTESADSINARYGSLLAAQPRKPQSFTLRFEKGSATDLTLAARTSLDELKAALEDWPAPQVMVIGHTDRVGSVQDNDRLSLDRARTVVDFLVEQGVSRELIESAGRGEREPLVSTRDGVSEAQNRRVEVNVR